MEYETACGLINADPIVEGELFDVTFDARDLDGSVVRHRAPRVTPKEIERIIESVWRSGAVVFCPGFLPVPENTFYHYPSEP